MKPCSVRRRVPASQRGVSNDKDLGPSPSPSGQRRLKPVDAGKVRKPLDKDRVLKRSKSKVVAVEACWKGSACGGDNRGGGGGRRGGALLAEKAYGHFHLSRPFDASPISVNASSLSERYSYLRKRERLAHSKATGGGSVDILRACEPYHLQFLMAKMSVLFLIPCKQGCNHFALLLFEDSCFVPLTLSIYTYV